MISKRFKNILLITLLLIGLHGLEEIISPFPATDPWMVFLGSLFTTKTEVFYWTLHIMWWILVVVGVILVIGNKRWVLAILSLFGILYFVEIHHVIKGILQFHYYPGMITGILYPILGIFYWKELFKMWRGK